MIVTGPPASGTGDDGHLHLPTSDRAGATFECRLGNAAFAPCTSPHSQTLTPGSYTFEVRASAGGLTDGSPASRSFTIEAALDTTITGQPAAATRSREATLSFHRQPQRRHLRVPPRRRGLCRLHLAQGLHRPRGRRAPLRGARGPR
jgi:hypothetical protein